MPGQAAVLTGCSCTGSTHWQDRQAGQCCQLHPSPGLGTQFWLLEPFLAIQCSLQVSWLVFVQPLQQLLRLLLCQHLTCHASTASTACSTALLCCCNCAFSADVLHYQSNTRWHRLQPQHMEQREAPTACWNPPGGCRDPTALPAQCVPWPFSSTLSATCR